jgi:hypothetical protein
MTTTATQEQIDKFISLKMERKTYFVQMKASNTNLSLLKKAKDPAYKEAKEKHQVLLEGWKKLNAEIDKLEDVVGKVKVPILKREKTEEEKAVLVEKRKNKAPKKEQALYIFPLLSKAEKGVMQFLEKNVFSITKELSEEFSKIKKQTHLDELLSKVSHI